MYNLKRYIFQTDIERRYMSAFNHYAIDIIYGDNILIGADIEKEYKNNGEEDNEDK